MDPLHSLLWINFATLGNLSSPAVLVHYSLQTFSFTKQCSFLCVLRCNLICFFLIASHPFLIYRCDVRSVTVIVQWITIIFPFCEPLCGGRWLDAFRVSIVCPPLLEFTPHFKVSLQRDRTCYKHKSVYIVCTDVIIFLFWTKIIIFFLSLGVRPKTCRTVQPLIGTHVLPPPEKNKPSTTQVTWRATRHGGLDRYVRLIKRAFVSSLHVNYVSCITNVYIPCVGKKKKLFWHNNKCISTSVTVCKSAGISVAR